MHLRPDEPENRAKWPKELKVVGNRLVDPSGREVWLQGLNAGGMESVPNADQIVKSTVVGIDEWKANCVRLPVNETFWFGRSAYQNDGGVQYRAAVDKIVRLAANRGAYVALDLHRFRAPKPEHVEFWKDAAKRYANHPAVLFDLFNEPHGISWKIWRDGGFVGEAGKVDALISYMKANPETSVDICGYADQATGTESRNLMLTKLRAEVVAKALKAAGIAESRISTEFYGTEKDSSFTPENNRLAVCIVK